MTISCIVAIAKNNVIGKDNNIPWYLPADLQYFKKQTSHHHILMGRNCYESIGKPLPNRTNIIITRDPFFISSNCIVCNTIEDGLGIAFDNGENELFIIGGGTIYDQTADIWDRIYLTEVDTEVEGDVFFPEIDYNQWKLISSEAHSKEGKNQFDYVFKVYERSVDLLN